MIENPFVQGFASELEKEASAKGISALLAGTLAVGGGYVAGKHRGESGKTEAVERARAATHARYQRTGQMGLQPLEPEPVTVGTGGLGVAPHKPGGTIVGTGGTGVSAEMAEMARQDWRSKVRMEDQRKAREVEESLKSLFGPEKPKPPAAAKPVPKPTSFRPPPAKSQVFAKMMRGIATKGRV